MITNVDALTYAGNPANLAGVAEEYRGALRVLPGRHRQTRTQMNALFARHQFYAVVNFAAESHVDRSIDSPGDFIHTNIVGTAVLLDAARRHGVRRFLQVSTDEVYGSLGPEGKFTETLADQAQLALLREQSRRRICSRWPCFHTYGQEVVITRCSNNYGPYQFPGKADPADDHQRARRQAAAGLWRRAECARLDSRRGPLRGDFRGAARRASRARFTTSAATARCGISTW